jgi:hypothetical protein
MLRVRAFLCVVLFAVGWAAPAGALRPAARAGAWAPPVDAPVTRRFAPPATRYGPGHLGVDYAVARGTAVRAAGPGVVAFAGVIAGAVHVVVAHDGGLRTSYSFLTDATVHRGETVALGDVVGHAGATGANHDGRVVHFGLRVGETYIDPLSLFRPPDLSKVVHLAPSRDPALASVAAERRGVLAGLARHVGAVGRAVVGAVAGAARGTVRVLGDAVVVSADVAQRIERLLGRGLPAVPELAALLETMRWFPVAADALQVARRLVQWAASLSSCDHHAPDADGTGGSGHEVMVVAGIGSHRTAGGASTDLPVERLGYDPAEARSFSYARDGGAYGPRDTLIPIEQAAHRLGDQLRAMQRANPGREVDLIAHSQGGVVALAFLALEYDPADRSLPPLGTVVTLSSPLGGAPLATLASFVGTTAPGRQLLEHFTLNGPSLRELREHSHLLDRLDGAPLPAVVDLTTIGAAGDYVVPATRAHRDGAASFDADPLTVSPHSAVVRDAAALRAVRAALEHRAMPCQSLGEAIDAALFPVVIEHVEGSVLDAVGRP